MSVREKNGRWYYEFMLFGIRKHGACRGCKNKTEALEYEADIKTELSLIKRGKKTAESMITVSEMMKLFLSNAKVNNKPKTYKIKEQQAELFKEFFGARTAISDITPAKIEELKYYITNKLGRSNATFNRYYASLLKAFNLIIMEHKLNMFNPCKYVGKLKENNRIERYLSEEEEKKLMKELAPHLKPIVICALQTGLRLSNILNLKWENINLEKDYIEVLKQDNKGHKQIIIPLSGKLKRVLKRIGVKKEGYVFINPETKKPFTTIKTGFNKALERAGITNFRFHDLRHTVGTRLVESGVDIMTVKELLAHSDIKTTERYLHTSKERLKNAIDKLE